MRRLVAAQRELHQGGETSQSDWSEEEEEEVQYCVELNPVLWNRSYFYGSVSGSI
jgi:hypothetical protein